MTVEQSNALSKAYLSKDGVGVGGAVSRWGDSKCKARSWEDVGDPAAGAETSR